MQTAMNIIEHMPFEGVQFLNAFYFLIVSDSCNNNVIDVSRYNSNRTRKSRTKNVLSPMNSTKYGFIVFHTAMNIPLRMN